MSRTPACHHFRLADLGAGDADRPGFQLAQGDLGAFVGLGVRPQGGGFVGEKAGHPGDVPLQCVEVEQQDGRVQVLDGCSWLGFVRHGACSFV